MTLMKSSILASVLVAVTLMGYQPANAQLTSDRPVVDITDRPVDIPHHILCRCVHRIKRLAHACIERNAEITKRCTHAIRFLLRQGRVELAKRIARHCIHHIEVTTKRCLHAIDGICARCRQALSDAGAGHDLFGILANVCEEAKGAVSDSGRRSIAAIKSLFDDRPTDSVGG
ncbi:MAG: hypothetical protein CMJ18_03010 [Phycisphaeraceae bacterium]|nr:hypothetical protein [Phycisphaeraceae bacterium]